MKILIEESVLRQALETLAKSRPYIDADMDMTHSEAELNLRSALANAEKVEPVAWMIVGAGDFKSVVYEKPSKGFLTIPLYTHPAPAVPSSYDAYKEHKRKKLEADGFLKSPLRESHAPAVPDWWKDFAVKLMTFIDTAPVSSGVCCCGDGMENHADPMSCGHNQVDQLDYAVFGLKEQFDRLATAQQPAAPTVPEVGAGGTATKSLQFNIQALQLLTYPAVIIKQGEGCAAQCVDGK